MATKAKTTTKKAPARKTVAAKTTRASVKSAPASTGRSLGVTLKELSHWRALGAEFVGTFLLASLVVVGQGQPIIVMFGLIGIVLLIGALSGAHVNPAVTIGAWVTRRITAIRAVGYLVAQFLGAALAFVTLSAFLGAAAPVSEDAQLFGASAPTLFAAVDVTALEGKHWFLFFSELLGTAILGLAIARATRERSDRVAASLTAGVGIFIALMVAVTAANYAGGSAIINPAVAVSLQALTWNVWPIAIYILAPVLGGVAGFILHDLLYGRNK